MPSGSAMTRLAASHEPG